MSALDFIIGGGMASIGGNVSERDRKEPNQFLKKFGELVKQIGKERNVPVTHLSIFKLSYLMVAKDTINYYVAFIDKGGNNELQYVDISSHGVISMDNLAYQLKMDIGEVAWMFSIPITHIKNLNDQALNSAASQYVQAVISSLTQQRLEIPADAATVPGLSMEIKAFEKDYPKTMKTAFIIMQFSKTKAHDAVVKTIKDTLKQHNIIGLRADDKEYSDDLFSNIRTYMHCCTFGIAVFERILEDNFNPNVSIEVGYMMGLNKKVCLLKDQTLKNLPSDLVGKLYKPFDPQDVDESMPDQIDKWLKDRELIS